MPPAWNIDWCVHVRYCPQRACPVFLNLHAKRALYHLSYIPECYVYVFHCYPKALIFSIYINKYLNERGLLGLFHS